MEKPSHRAVDRLRVYKRESPAFDIEPRLSRTSTDASGPLGPGPELGCQARNLAQLLGHFLEPFRRLLRCQLRFGHTAGEDRVAFPLGIQQLLNLLGFCAAALGVRQST